MWTLPCWPRSLGVFPRSCLSSGRIWQPRLLGSFRSRAGHGSRPVPLPRTDLMAQICGGDAHVQNLGAFEAPDGRLIFDINDFDESIIGPWEWDVKRMSASLVLAGREAHNSEKQCKDAALAFVRRYRTWMRRFSDTLAAYLMLSNLPPN